MSEYSEKEINQEKFIGTEFAFIQHLHLWKL